MSPVNESRPEASKKSIAALRNLMPFIAPYKATICLALLFLFLAAAMTLSMPVAFRRVIDFGVVANNQESVAQHFWLLLGLGCLLAVFSSARFLLVSWIGERVVADLRAAVFGHILKLSPHYFEENRTGEILSRLTTDTTLIQNVVGSSVSIALRSFVTLVGGLFMLAITSFKLAGILLLTLPFVVGPVVLIGRRIRRLSRLSQDRIADTSAVAGEILNAMNVVQAFSLESIKRQKFNTAVEAAFHSAKRRIFTRAGLTGIAMVSIFACIVAVLWIGTIDVIEGTMSGGELGQFLLYAIIVGGSTTVIGEIWGSLQQAAGATERILELLATEPTITAPPSPITLPQDLSANIRFDHVDFHYPARPESNALSNFSLEVLAGESVAFVSATGGGKSTVFQLLMSFHRPTGGRILIDGHDLALVDPIESRKLFAMVPQQTILFAGTVLENIRFGKPTASDDEVMDAARKASAHEFILKLPAGYQAELGERGARLSGGQQQRIAIARALLRSPKFMLLDEATSALDSENEALVQSSLKTLPLSCTTFIIAHRLSTIMEADRIIVMEKGEIVAQGSHEELANKTGVYSRLVELQIKNGLVSERVEKIPA